MSCNKIQPAEITAELAAGSTASPYQYTINISQRLCYPVCAENVPVFLPQFAVAGSPVQIDTNLYVVPVQVQGTINYIPCNGGCRSSKPLPINQTFNIKFVSATAPTGVTIATGNSVNSIATAACQKCSRAFVSETPLTLTVTAAAAA